MNEKQENSEELTNLIIRLPKDLKQSAMEKAEKNDMNVSQVVRKLLREYLSQQQATLNF